MLFKILMNVLRKLHVVQKNAVSTFEAVTSVGVDIASLATREIFGANVEVS